jgi:hypothetical protein
MIIKFTGNSFDHDGCTTYLSSIGHKGKCRKLWQGEYDDETGTIVLTCECGGGAKIEMRTEPMEGDLE